MCQVRPIADIQADAWTHDAHGIRADETNAGFTSHLRDAFAPATVGREFFVAGCDQHIGNGQFLALLEQPFNFRRRRGEDSQVNLCRHFRKRRPTGRHTDVFVFRIDGIGFVHASAVHHTAPDKRSSTAGAVTCANDGDGFRIKGGGQTVQNIHG